MTPPDLTSRLDDHDDRLSAVEGRLGAAETTLDMISRDIVAIRAEGQARSAAQTAGLDRLGGQIQALIVQSAKQTGAQEEQSRLAKESLNRWRKIAVIVGIICTASAAVGSTLLSDQEVASTIWVKWLHKKEPWDIKTTINGGVNDSAH